MEDARAEELREVFRKRVRVGSRLQRVLDQVSVLLREVPDRLGKERCHAAYPLM